MNQFTKDQTNTVRMLLSMFHPDKCPAEYKDCADGFTKAINKARDQGIYSVISQILGLVAKYGITKDSKDRMPEAWAEFSAEPEIKGSGQQSKPNDSKAKAKESKEHRIDPEILRKAKARQDATGWDRSKMGSWLNLEFDLKGAAAKIYLDEIFRSESTGGGRDKLTDSLYAKLKSGPITKEEFEAWAKSTGSDNLWKHRSKHWAVCEMANAIWAKK